MLLLGNLCVVLRDLTLRDHVKKMGALGSFITSNALFIVFLAFISISFYLLTRSKNNLERYFVYKWIFIYAIFWWIMFSVDTLKMIINIFIL